MRTFKSAIGTFRPIDNLSERNYTWTVGKKNIDAFSIKIEIVQVQMTQKQTW